MFRRRTKRKATCLSGVGWAADSYLPPLSYYGPVPLETNLGGTIKLATSRDRPVEGTRSVRGLPPTTSRASDSGDKDGASCPTRSLAMDVQRICLKTATAVRFTKKATDDFRGEGSIPSGNGVKRAWLHQLVGGEV